MVFLDFDGTIVNLWPRYYRAFCMASGAAGVTQAQYLAAKRRFPADGKLAEHLQVPLPDDYFSRKRGLLESRQLLQHDTLLLPREELISFFGRYDCRILTSRRREPLFREELARLGLEGLAAQAIVLDPDKMGKKEYLQARFPAGCHVLVGDSEAEWEAGALENVRVALVRSGLRRPEDFPLTGRHLVFHTIAGFLTGYRGRGLKLWES